MGKTKLAPTASSVQERAAADEILRRLDLNPGVSFGCIVARVSELYGKKLQLVPVESSELAMLSGLWVETDKVGYVYFRADDPVAYKLHSIFHEFGHALDKHTDCNVLRVLEIPALETMGLGEQMRNAQARGLLDSPAERSAELVAYALSSLLLHPQTSPHSAAFE